MAVTFSVAPNAFAGTAEIDGGNTLMLVFAGLLALVVAVQLIPAHMTLFGAFKGFTKKENTPDAGDEAGE